MPGGFKFTARQIAPYQRVRLADRILMLTHGHSRWKFSKRGDVGHVLRRKVRTIPDENSVDSDARMCENGDKNFNHACNLVEDD